MKNILIIIVSLISGMSSYLIAHKLNKGTVVGSSLTSLVGALLLLLFFPEYGLLLASACSCASYAGMVSIKNASNYLGMAAISLITGIIFILAQGSYIGVGGRLGTIAGIACLIWIGIREIIIKVYIERE
ncbi:MAG: hypothetical protein GX219_06975 [Tissierellia bacterium]|nr:hypothetical protein [Tissierellia bacterium]